jgi:hypothetical protein
VFCGKCGSEIGEGYAFCTKCGSAGSEAPPKAGQENGGASKVSRSRTIFLVLYLIFVTWVGSAGIAYGVVELTGGGPQGEQGEQGPKGARGASGPAGSSGSALGTSTPLRRLAVMWAVERIGEAGDHPQVQACVDYIMDGTGSFVECGFTR